MSNYTARFGKPFFAAGLLFALGLLAYSNAFNGQFQFDDYNQIVENPYIRDVGNIPRFFASAALGSEWSSYFGLKGYRPVTFTSFAVSCAFSGYHVFGYHLMNVLLNFINALLLCVLIKAIQNNDDSETAARTALCAAAIFLLHPIQTNAVTYISGRAVLLATLFYLAGLVSFVLFRKSGDARKGYVYAAAAPVLYLLGLLSKEMAVSMPAMMLSYDLFFTVPERGGFKKSRRAWLFYIPFLAVLVSYLVLKKSFQGFVASSKTTIGLTGYLMSEAKALLLYVRLMLLPINQNADYNLPVTSSVDAGVVAAVFFIALAIYALFLLRRKNPAAAFFGFWFFIALLPESSLFPIPDIAVEYRLYLPSAGLIAMAVLLLSKPAFLKPRARAAAALAVVVLFGILTFNRNIVWESGTSLWEDVVAKATYSARAHGNLGKALLDAGRYSDAAKEIEIFLDSSPSDQGAYVMLNNLGVCYKETGRMEQAVNVLIAASKIFPNYPDAYENLGSTYYRMRRYSESDEAYRKAAAIKSGK